MKLKRQLYTVLLATVMFLFTPMLTDAASHTVGKGDTLYSLAKKYNTTVYTIKSLNNLNTDLIRIGQILVLPDATPIFPTLAPETVPAPIPAPLLAPVLTSTSPQSADSTTHTVVRGDTLYNLAKKYNTTVEAIKNLNNLNSNSIRIGQVLAIPAATAIYSTSQPAESVQSVVVSPEYTEYRMLATAYTANCRGCSGITASGINLKKNPNAKVIAVDPAIIPLGTKVYVEGYGEAIAGDTGGSIKGHKIDVFYPTTKLALNWGRRTVTVKVY